MPHPVLEADPDGIVRDLAASALSALPASLCLLDERADIRLVNTAWRGFAMEAGTIPVREGVNYLDVCDSSAASGDADAKRFAEGLRAVMSGARQRHVQETPCATPGGMRWFVVRANAFRMRGRRWVLVLHDDVTDLKLTEAALEHATAELERRIAQRAEPHDGLTGLPNRALLTDRLEQALEDARNGPQNNPQNAFSLLLVDLDGFGVLNRHFGGEIGDSVLLEAARRIVAVAPPNSVARVGGDEFGVLLRHQGGPADAEALAVRIGERMAAPFPVGDSFHRMSASIGIVHSHSLTAQDDPGAILAAADLAKLSAQERGGGHWDVFQPGHRARAKRSFEMADAMREAVGDGRAPEGFSLVYQPVVDLATGRVAGFEALMRWTHPVLGSVPPGDFIPLAEALGLIFPLGAWAVREGCAQLARWQREFLGELPAGQLPFISVNVSARQLHEPGFEQMIRSTLAETGAPPSALKLEVTESAILDNAQRAAAVLSALQSEGIRIAIDDFGTGFSCLGYLSRFRFDDLKIDASFVRDMTGNERAMAVVKTIVELGRGLEMSIIAEGAEHRTEVEALGRIGCPLIQGYFFGRPHPVAEAERLLRQGVENWSPALAS
ncbi:putative bifunctional diguanylate cyclase/phosphodiesterase [Azospirillum sp. sgz302134]